MAIILDTHALSAFADGDTVLGSVIEQERELAVPVIVLGEYLFGIKQSRHRLAYEKWLSEQLRHFLLLPVRADTARHYAAVMAELKAAGRPIPTNDLWIAAIALEHNGRLLTRDQHFRSVPGLRIVSW